MIKLRPHHILCIENFKGKGYDDKFIKNMIFIIYKLKNNPSQNIEIVFEKDSICEKCPNKLSNNLCVTQEKVKNIDDKVVEKFNIKQGVYNYKQLKDYINENMTYEKFNYICSECEWNKQEICQKRFC